jgi:hypothetical protein
LLPQREASDRTKSYQCSLTDDCAIKKLEYVVIAILPSSSYPRLLLEILLQGIPTAIIISGMEDVLVVSIGDVCCRPPKPW